MSRKKPPECKYAYNVNYKCKLNPAMVARFSVGMTGFVAGAMVQSPYIGFIVADQTAKRILNRILPKKRKQKK